MDQGQITEGYREWLGDECAANWPLMVACFGNRAGLKRAPMYESCGYDVLSSCSNSPNNDFDNGDNYFDEYYQDSVDNNVNDDTSDDISQQENNRDSINRENYQVNSDDDKSESGDSDDARYQAKYDAKVTSAVRAGNKTVPAPSSQRGIDRLGSVLENGFGSIANIFSRRNIPDLSSEQLTFCQKSANALRNGLVEIVMSLRLLKNTSTSKQRALHRCPFEMRPHCRIISKKKLYFDKQLILTI
jgi:hypothetical protein